ncbi:MAG: hypothetical protein LUB58_02140 [Oscillospiraceae bacterium]|nr:hypothetical protein [Oscillospiraceae bacterium]MCD8240182.1 hypothetical protein [Oscillospiraceae bacterium]MCD8255808.1 hypothetical protein [Oscillospiraceae bacterium]
MKWIAGAGGVCITKKRKLHICDAFSPTNPVSALTDNTDEGADAAGVFASEYDYVRSLQARSEAELIERGYSPVPSLRFDDQRFTLFA